MNDLNSVYIAKRSTIGEVAFISLLTTMVLILWLNSGSFHCAASGSEVQSTDNN